VEFSEDNLRLALQSEVPANASNELAFEKA